MSSLQDTVAAALSLEPRAKHVVVVPIYNEPVAGVRRFLASPAFDSSALAVLVVNRRVSASRELNDDVLRSLATLQPQHVRGNVSWSVGSLVIDSSSRDEDCLTHGVGEARNIGGTVAYHLIKAGLVKDSWIHNTDADSVLPEGYFEVAASRWTPRSSLCFRSSEPFFSDPDLREVSEACDLCGRVIGLLLEECRVPWAVPTTGCGVAIDADTFARIGGFQPYEWAEDGYLINAAGKSGRMHRVCLPGRVGIEARPFSRTGNGYGNTIRDSRDVILSGEPFGIQAPLTWACVRAAYRAIELCCVEQVPLIDAVAKACDDEFMGCKPPYAFVFDTVLKFAGPVDTMFSDRSPRDKYVAIHTFMDLRRSQQLVRHTRNVLSEWGAKIEDVIAVCPWERVRKCAGDTEACLQALKEVEEAQCNTDAGAEAAAERVFACR